MRGNPIIANPDSRVRGNDNQSVGETGFRARPNQAIEGGRYLDREERLEGLLRSSGYVVLMASIFHQVP